MGCSCSKQDEVDPVKPLAVAPTPELAAPAKWRFGKVPGDKRNSISWLERKGSQASAGEVVADGQPPQQTPPASKPRSRLGSKSRRKLGSKQSKLTDGSPVEHPPVEGSDSSFGESGSDTDSDPDWDRYTSGEVSTSTDAASDSTSGVAAARAVGNENASPATNGVRRGGSSRYQDKSLFGLTDKKERGNLKETASLKLAKLRGCTFVNQYVVIKYLGRGACGRVFLCMDMDDNRLYAVKMVKKLDLEAQRTKGGHRRRRNPIDDLRREVSIMKNLRHKNIVSLQEVVDDPRGNKMLLVMDYMEGGPVMTREALERGRCIPEPLALQYFRDMLKALDYLHFHRVVHGDLKPENVLMSARGNVTLSDFGCSKVIISGNEYLERCNGTPAFLAPEMMRPHTRYRGRPTDVYALGACLFTFVYGRIPFNAPNVFKLFQVVQNEPLRFPEDVPVSEELRDLLWRMLAKNPKERISVSKMMRHPWVTKRGSWPLRSCKELLRAGETPDEEPQLPDMMATANVLDIPRQDHLLEVTSAPGLPEKTFENGQYLLRQGEQGIFMMFILSGQVEVLLKLPPAKDSNSNRLRRLQTERVAEDVNDGGAAAMDTERSNASRNSTGDVLGDDLPPALLEGASKAHEFTAMLARGAREYLVAVRNEGQLVGEMALFATAAVRCASVRAKGRVRVRIIPGENLRAVVNRIPEARQQVQEMVWMKQSENMVLEAMTRLSTVHDALEDLLRSDFSSSSRASISEV